ncbi:MAG TPA: RluA family pseudouridine synthase [Chitinophagaceae bacterium]|nr:RluA family pseudouridine synthase [Chitinophagaceae bacterium]
MKPNPDIIFENDDLVAINKPAGMLSIPDRTQSEPSLKDILATKYGTIFTVHRLDKETSGVIVFAKNEAAHKYLSQQFENRETDKYYLGLVQGKLSEKKGVIEEAIIEHPVKKGLMTTARKGKPSITEYEVLEETGGYSLLQFKILTGRTHQIRVHMKFLGHTIVCDELYGNPQPILLSSIKKSFKLSLSEENERPLLNRLALHSYKLILKDPAGIEHTLEASLPKDMRALLTQLKKWK